MDSLGNWLANNLKWLKNQLIRRGRVPADAEDLIQEGIARVYEYRARGGAVREPEAVLLRTISRLSINERRTDRSHIFAWEGAETLAVADQNLQPDQILDLEQRLDGIARVLETVPDRTREIFFLHRLGEAGHQEIARQMGISVSAVEKHVARAMAALVAARLKE